ncbi:hypothetical protein AXG93_3954s1040 [Marchantia polymorpha subsp. ruderalis]|uniref:Uncharacterized protein n=1 Tax=Marchantia polymorpha subsp. ruderalis TaxID=1480154 RepID=A0A176VKF8_MARPO|nr:hypothetical protein AXG93_3954s1040 [Marchantia polymorpha subsp. ruderalis]
MLQQRHSVVFGKESSDFGVSAFGVTDKKSLWRSIFGEVKDNACGSPTTLDILAGSSAEATAAEATQPNSRESPGNSVATKILNSEDEEDESSSEEQEEESVQGTPTTALCVQVVPLLRYLNRKVAKYADSRHLGSYVEFVQKRTRTKVRTSSLLASLDETIKDLRLKNDALRGHLVRGARATDTVTRAVSERTSSR